MRAAVQHLGGDGRHQHRVGHAHGADQGQEQQRRPDRREVGHVVEARPQLVQHPSSRRRALACRGSAHREQRRDHREVGDRVDQEAPSLAHRGDQHAADRRTEDPARVHHGGVERDGVGQVGAVLDHAHHERLPRRGVEGVDHALTHLQHQHLGDGDDAGQRQHRERQRLQHREHLGDDQHAVPVPPVDEHAGHGARNKVGIWPQNPTTPSSSAEPVRR